MSTDQNEKITINIGHPNKQTFSRLAFEIFLRQFRGFDKGRKKVKKLFEKKQYLIFFIWHLIRREFLLCILRTSIILFTTTRVIVQSFFYDPIF